MLYIIEGLSNAQIACNSDSELISILEEKVTDANYKGIKVASMTFDNVGIKVNTIYNFNDDATALISKCGAAITLPESITNKLKPKTVPVCIKQEVPVCIEQTPRYLIIKGQDLYEKSSQDLEKEISGLDLQTIRTVIIYDLQTKDTYTFSDTEFVFKSKCKNKQLSLNLTQHLTATYKMLIVTAEDPTNPFKLTKKYICEKKVLLNNTDESVEMRDYRVVQLVGMGGEFKYDGLTAGHLVKIYFVKNNVIIGELNNKNILYNGVVVNTPNSGEFCKCNSAVSDYITHVNTFRKKSAAEISAIYYEFLRAIGPNHEVFCPYLTINESYKMIDIMIKANELIIYKNQ